MFFCGGNTPQKNNYFPQKIIIFLGIEMPKNQPKKYKIQSQIGIFIYAYARSYMWNTLFKNTKVYYTDSGIISRHYYEIMVKQGLIGDRFGQFKNEGYVNKLVVIAPNKPLKEHGNYVIKARCKGVGLRDTFEDVKELD